MKYYEKDESMIGRKIADELILVPTKQNVVDLQCIYTLNELGGRIWELIDGGTSVEAIVTVLTQEYKVEVEQAEADLLNFLNELEQIGAISLVTSEVSNQLEAGN